MNTAKALAEVCKLQRYLKSHDITLRITGFSEASSQLEEGKTYKYPECIEVTIENWSTSHYSVRTKDLCWIRSGENLNRTKRTPVTKVFQMHLKELKAFNAYKAKCKEQMLKLVSND